MKLIKRSRKSGRIKSAVYPDDIDPAYYDDVFHRARGIQSKWHHLKFSRFRRDLPSDSDHLDVGCGPGTFIGTLETGHRSIGADVSEEFLKIARTRYGGGDRTFIHMEPDVLELDSNSFDVVTCIEVIEHMEEEQANRLLGEMLRVLRPGGALLMSTPNYASPWPIVENLVNRFGDVSYDHHHITSYTPLRLSGTLQSVGYSGVEVFSWMLAAPFAAALGWRFADMVADLEPNGVVRRWGLLLYAKAFKPSV
jgi:2-polyprenyl-3-methyl-5-hydroxy-6-metoxy-1,4-benzoquinol methylase